MNSRNSVEAEGVDIGLRFSEGGKELKQKGHGGKRPGTVWKVWQETGTQGGRCLSVPHTRLTHSNLCIGSIGSKLKRKHGFAWLVFRLWWMEKKKKVC